MNTSQKGQLGEDIAASFLIKKGHTILERNYRYKHSEIDLITLFDNIIIFTEVKLRKTSQFGFPEEFVSKTKSKLIKAAAENYIIEKNWFDDIRFDIISIIKNASTQEILHLEDAL